MVSAMLMRRSQLQPVIMATAAGGKMMAMSAMMMSDPRTMVTMCVVSELVEREIER